MCQLATRLHRVAARHHDLSCGDIGLPLTSYQYAVSQLTERQRVILAELSDEEINYWLYADLLESVPDYLDDIVGIVLDSLATCH